MIERHPSAMLLDHREGWTQDVSLAQIESARETFDETGLARTEIAYQPEQLSAFEHRGEPATPALGLMRRVGFDNQRHIGKRAPYKVLIQAETSRSSAERG